MNNTLLQQARDTVVGDRIMTVEAIKLAEILAVEASDEALTFMCPITFVPQRLFILRTGDSICGFHISDIEPLK